MALFLCLLLNLQFLPYALSENIPSSLIKAPVTGAAAILVEKNTQTLRVYTYQSDTDQYDKVFETSCSTGEAAGRKTLEGDKKTPEGVYLIKEIFEDRYLTPIYGKRAFTTDYPNLLDTILGRTGSAIWIHGTNKILKSMDSNGCVAMNNHDVVKLDQYIRPDETPVILADHIEYSSQEQIKREKISVLKFLEQWCNTLNSGTYHEFLSYYSDDYLPEMEWWMDWKQLRSTTPPGHSTSPPDDSASPPDNNNGEVNWSSIFADYTHVGIYRQGEQLVVLFDLMLRSVTYPHYPQASEIPPQTLEISPRPSEIPPQTSEVSPQASEISPRASEISPRASVTIGKRKFFIEPRTSLDLNVDSGFISVSTNRLTYQIIGDQFQVLAAKVKHGEVPLILAATAFRGNKLTSYKIKK